MEGNKIKHLQHNVSHDKRLKLSPELAKIKGFSDNDDLVEHVRSLGGGGSYFWLY